MHLDVLWNCLVDESLVANINKLKEIRVDEAIGSGNGELGGSERCLGMKMDFIVLDVAECELSGLMPRLPLPMLDSASYHKPTVCSSQSSSTSIRMDYRDQNDLSWLWLSEEEESRVRLLFCKQQSGETEEPVSLKTSSGNVILCWRCCARSSLLPTGFL
ncbi:hypothetical protein MJT46_016194 [Ovis ammon polii x Ovis aries]|nr:hypothetical protein MJT46_016194 [Ovis ammon polii x Ovis aries]